MTRLVGPDGGVRSVYHQDADRGWVSVPAGTVVPLFTDPALTQLADIITLDGDPIIGSLVAVDEYSQLPLVQYPDGINVLYTSVAEGPSVALPAEINAIADDLASRIDAPASPSPSDALHRQILAEVYTFTDWCSAYGVKGLIGEFGTPASGPDVTAWLAALETYLRALDETGMSAVQWASGGGWGTGYELAVYVDSAGANINTAMPPAAVLERHPGIGGARRGVSLAGWDFPVSGGGANGIRNPASYYRVHTEADFAYLASRGVRTIRLGMAWERLQPVLNGPLDTTALAQLGTFLTYAAAHRIACVLDLHNYGRYTAMDGVTVHVIAESGGVVNVAELADFWVRMSAWVRADVTRNRAVIGYELMNEPHDLAPGLFVPALTLHDFAAGVGSWTGSPTRTTNLFADGAGTWSVPAGGGQFDDQGTWGNLSQYGNTLRMVFQAPAGLTGDFTVDPKLQRGPGNPTGSQYSTASGPGVTISEAGPTVLDWAVPAGTLDSVGWVGFYAGGGGRVGNQLLYLDRVQVGSSKTPAQAWEAISSAVVTAIRAAGDHRLVVVDGYAYSQLHTWTANHPTPWVDDANVLYGPHHYWDLGPTATRTGTYQDPYAAVLAAAAAAGF